MTMSSDLTLFDYVSSLVTLDEKQVAKIHARLPEYHRAKTMVGHGGSQHTSTLQSMHMISDSPYSRLKQCLAQISKLYNGLQEGYFKIEAQKIEIDEFMKKTDRKSRLEVRRIESEINTHSEGMESNLRKIGMFQDMYDGIIKNNNIPENWTEEDYEKSEISNLIKKSFRLGIQDLQATGRVSKAAVEWWEQLGIHPQLAESRIRTYQVNTQNILNDLDHISITLMYDFLDEMVKEFKDTYKLALKRIGLDEIGSKDFMVKGVTKPQ